MSSGPLFRTLFTRRLTIRGVRVGSADWWNTAKRAPDGCGNLVSVEHWQVQVRMTSTSALRTFELRCDPLSEQWLLAAITDAGAAAA